MTGPLIGAAGTAFGRTTSRRSTPSSSAELRGELLGLVREDHHVQADRGEDGAPFDVAARRGLVGREDARGLAASLDAPDRILDRRLHFGMARVAQVAEARGEVRGADEDDAPALA